MPRCLLLAFTADTASSPPRRTERGRLDCRACVDGSHIQAKGGRHRSTSGRRGRLNSRTRPRTVAVPATPSPRPGRMAGRDPEPTTDVAVEMAARLQAGIRERAAARRPSADLEAIPEAEGHQGEEGGAGQAVYAAQGGRDTPVLRLPGAPAAAPAQPHRQRRSPPRCARPVPDAALERLAVVTTPDTVNWVDRTMSDTGWSPSSGQHLAGDT